MFRGKESSNRIELSQLVQDLLNFGVLGSLQLWGWGGWVDGVGVGELGGWGWGWLGGASHTCAHARTHMHARACMHGKHDNPMQMAAPIGFGEIPGIPYDVICACVHMHACAHVWGTLSPPPTPIHPTPDPQGVTPRISQNSIALELIEIFQFCLKI